MKHNTDNDLNARIEHPFKAPKIDTLLAHYRFGLFIFY